MNHQRRHDDFGSRKGSRRLVKLLAIVGLIVAAVFVAAFLVRGVIQL